MAVVDLVRNWHLDVDFTHRKMFNDVEGGNLWYWTRQALSLVLVEKTADLMKHRLILQQARALAASGFVHCLLQEHRLAGYAGLNVYTQYYLGPQKQILENTADVVCTKRQIDEFMYFLWLRNGGSDSSESEESATNEPRPT